jgi:NADH-quinone oxidoreductase subunit M
MLTAIVMLPAAGAIVLALLARGDRQVRLGALLITMTVLVLSLIVWAGLDLDNPDPQFVQKHSWIAAFDVQYFIGVDGLSAPLLALTSLLGVAAVLVSWGIKHRTKEFFFFLLFLQAGISGVFVSFDMLLFFLFWEVELIPMFFLITIWGSGRKEYSALKFLLFTAGSSALMLTGILVLYSSTGTFDMIELRDTPFSTVLITAPGVFFLLFAAFAVKLPIWPFHTWLPDAHTDAPTAASVMLAGVMLKMGGYAIIRLCISLFPDVAQDYAWLLATLAVINVLYGAILVFRQRDLKRLIAFSSVSHMGFVLLGIASMSEVGLNGAALQMFTHGTITGMLFMLAGLVYDKAHTRHIPDLGGLAPRMPILAIGFTIAALATLGLPTMSGFVSELLVFLGTFGVYREATILALFGIVFAAAYMLWTVQRVFLGPEKPRFAAIGDATILETIPLVAMVIVIMVVGIYPALVTDTFSAGLAPIVNILGATGG